MDKLNATEKVLLRFLLDNAAEESGIVKPYVNNIYRKLNLYKQ